MILKTVEELRLCFPTSAMDDMTPMSAFLVNSEHDFLKDKLGDKLYKSLCEYYASLTGTEEYIAAVQDNENELMPYEHLLFLSQRAITYDAFSRAIGVLPISLNNAGVNVMQSDDYKAPDQQTVAAFKSTCIKEAHIAVNMLLEFLEQLEKEEYAYTLEQKEQPAETEAPEEASSDETENETSDADKEKQILEQRKEICDEWKESRYYFIVTGLLIPSAEILNLYVTSFYDNREKFINMLPDLHYIQDENIAPYIGEDFVDYLAKVSINGTEDKALARLITRLRKCEAAFLEERTDVISVSKERKSKAHDEADRHLKAAIEYCERNQDNFDKDIVKDCPWYVEEQTCDCKYKPKFDNSDPDNAIFVMPAIN